MNVPPARIAALRRRLLVWYDAAGRTLPWRFPQRGADPYRVWIAEVMLQQTQVRTAIPFYERFVSRFPTLEALARAEEEEVLALWSGLGYYARARNLPRAAREALRVHGELPRSLEALVALPGFGPYTAGAVASIAFAIPVAAVDGNVARVLARLFLVRGEPTERRVRVRLHALARLLARGTRPGDLNQALMDLGATVCGKPAPACGECPVEPLCAARAAGRERKVPPPRRRPDRRRLVFACAILRRGDAILLARRPTGGLFGGLFAPPAADVAARGDPRRTLARTLRADYGLDAAVREEVGTCDRTLTHRALTLRAFRCEARGPVPETARLRFAAPADLAALPIPAAVHALLDVTARIALTGEGAPV